MSDLVITAVTPSENYIFSTWLFLRLLGLIYACAFISLRVQIKGLIGKRGLLPAVEFLNLKIEHRKVQKKSYTLLRIFHFLLSSDCRLQLVCDIGILLSLLAIIGFIPPLVFFLLWIGYLSLLNICQIFLRYQWDILLLETGFLAIFLTPLQVFPHGPSLYSSCTSCFMIRWLFYWLLFRLMFSSGIRKLQSGDPYWRNLTALNYHYETQPLPTRLGWYAHQLPTWFHKISVIFMFMIELIFPFLIFGPLPLRYLAAGSFIIFMLLIMATGNYGFFNLLTIVLSLFLFDDSFYLPIFRFFVPSSSITNIILGASWPLWMILLVMVVILLLSTIKICWMFGLKILLPSFFEKLIARLEPLNLVNIYGLFTVMTTKRPEIIVEGSHDGSTWETYEFKWKPGDLKQPPRWAAPHQPRLDWQVWFAALGDLRSNTWFLTFLQRLLEGTPEILALLKKNPFINQPPRYIRAMVYDYHFTNHTTHRRMGLWWQRHPQGFYCPVFSLRGVEEKWMPPHQEIF